MLGDEGYNGAPAEKLFNQGTNVGQAWHVIDTRETQGGVAVAADPVDLLTGFSQDVRVAESGHDERV